MKLEIHFPAVLCVVLALSVLAPNVLAEEGEFYWRVYAHGTAERFSDSDDSVQTDIARFRPKVQYTQRRFTGVLQADLAVEDTSDRRPGTLQNAMLDLFGSVRFGASHALTIGQFKTPLGMDFNLPGDRLSITQRGMEVGTTFNRDVGVMVSGQHVVGGFSYDVGVFNPPGRSAAAMLDSSQVGDDFLLVGRLRFDHKQWHAEIAHGRTDNAGGAETADYGGTNIGVRFTPDRWRFGAEWMDGRGVRGISQHKERVFYVDVGYQLNRALELVVRHYGGRSTRSSGSTELTNTYLGLTWKLAPLGKLNSRLQLNYLIAAKDKAAYTGMRGFRDNAWFVQLQLHVEK